jgi:pimeloyl-ACP methyl ester carboxylesterase
MRVVVVPGLAVRRYLEPTEAALSRRGYRVQMPAAPGAPEGECDLRRYGETLAVDLRRDGEPVVVGLSVGCQAAAVAAASARVRHLVLVSPTVDPQARSGPALARAWLRATTTESSRLGLEQVPDWRRAGVRRLRQVLRSALKVHLERVLPDVDAPVTVVHAEQDSITSHSYAAMLAAAPGRQLVVVPGATHSWPYADEERFADFLGTILP